MLRLLFWTSAAGLTWVYGGYPALTALLARVRPLRLVPSRPTPGVSIGIAVHDEAEVIRDRIADALAQDGPESPIVEVIVGSDGSTDGTEAVVRALAEADPRVRLLSLERIGQTATQDALFAAATGEVVVLTDAETRFEVACIAHLIRPFRDPRVGCTTGRLEWRDQDATATSANEGMYWRYERLVRGLESRAGLLTAVTGALLAIRRASYRPVPASASMDHLLPLYVREAGLVVVYVPDAIATDRPISGLREQFRSRSRTATRGIAANLSMAGRLPPWSHPGPALAVWSHKLLRWGTPWLAATAVMSGAGLAAQGYAAYVLAPLGFVGVFLAGAVAHLQAGSGHRPHRFMAFARSLLVVNAAFAIAWVNVIRGRRIEVWHRAEWKASVDSVTRPSGASGPARGFGSAKPGPDDDAEEAEPVAQGGALLR
jgi:hypothetical protein